MYNHLSVSYENKVMSKAGKTLNACVCPTSDCLKLSTCSFYHRKLNHIQNKMPNKANRAFACSLISWCRSCTSIVWLIMRFEDHPRVLIWTVWAASLRETRQNPIQWEHNECATSSERCKIKSEKAKAREIESNKLLLFWLKPLHFPLWVDPKLPQPGALSSSDHSNTNTDAPWGHQHTAHIL